VADGSDVIVQDDPAGNRYELLIDGVRGGDLHYLPTRGAVVLVHTEIAPDLEGQGFGGRLIAGALEDLRTRELIIIPVCPFVRSYLERHPEYADLLERSTETPREGG
jgi:predicted GNAT family acetyltransferase